MNRPSKKKPLYFLNRYHKNGLNDMCCKQWYKLWNGRENCQDRNKSSRQLLEGNKFSSFWFKTLLLSAFEISGTSTSQRAYAGRLGDYQITQEIFSAKGKNCNQFSAWSKLGKSFLWHLGLENVSYIMWWISLREHWYKLLSGTQNRFNPEFVWNLICFSPPWQS